MRLAVLGAVLGYITMLVVVAISIAGDVLGHRTVANAMIFHGTRGFGVTDGFDWRLVIPVIVGLGVGLLLAGARVRPGKSKDA